MPPAYIYTDANLKDSTGTSLSNKNKCVYTCPEAARYLNYLIADTDRDLDGNPDYTPTCMDSCALSS